MPLSDRWWAEFSTAELGDLQAANVRFLRERCNGDRKVYEAIVTALAAVVDPDGTEEPLTATQIGDFMEGIGVPPPMFVECLLPANQLVLWTGKAKAGKSLAAMQIMEDVAKGRPVFGEFEVNGGGPVLYLAMEDGEQEINRRFRARGLEPSDKDTPIYVVPQFRNYGTPEAIRELRALIETLPAPPVLIVVDTLTESFDSVRDWNDRNQVKRAMRPLRTFAQTYCTVLAISHNVKGSGEERDSGDEIAGSLAVLSSADGYLSCYKRTKMENGNLRLHIRGGGRGGIVPGEFMIEMDTNTYQWRSLDDEEVTEAKRAEQKAQKERQYDKIERAIIAENGGATIREIAKHTGMSDAYVREVVKTALDDGIVIQNGSRRAGNIGRAAPVYALPERPTATTTAPAPAPVSYFNTSDSPIELRNNKGASETVPDGTSAAHLATFFADLPGTANGAQETPA